MPLILFVYLVSLSACIHSLPRFGLGGQYEEAKEQFMLGNTGDMDKAVVALESVVRESPTYKDSLTLLGRAYYRKARFEDAHAILQRALAVKKDDEIAWLVLGAAQLRLNQDDKGLEAMKGGITLLSRVAVNGYRDYPIWDTRGTVRTSIQRTAFFLAKGMEAKEEILGSLNTLLFRIDDEENYQRRQTYRREKRDN
jgi:tetratricopeptide (TPR) repeat protein